MEASAEIPEMLAKEARMCSDSRDEADEYVMERIDGVRLEWPEGHDDWP
jgi:hypothetical protein